MTFIPGMPLAFDPPTGWKQCSSKWTCRKCGYHIGIFRTHSSSDGAFDDDEVKCAHKDCGYTYWVEGPDS